MESLAEIMARVERLALAQEEERQIRPYALQPLSSDEQVTLRLTFPQTEMLPPPEYIQAEAFLEVSGYFTPSSKRIRRIYTKEKKLREYIDEHGNRRTLKVKISANHELGLPITSDLDYYRAFLKICDESVDHEGRFRPPIAVSSSRLARYAGKPWNLKTRREIQEWFDRMAGTLMKGAIYLAKKKDYDDGATGAVFSWVCPTFYTRRSWA